MELSTKSSCQYVTWKVRDFFELPSEIGYVLDSPEFRFAGDSYCLRLYPNGTQRYKDEVWFDIKVVRLTSTFPERSVSCKAGFRWRDEKSEVDRYWKVPSNILRHPRSPLQDYRNKYVPDGTFTVLCSMSLKEQSSTGSQQSEEEKTSDNKEEQKRLTGQSVFFLSRLWSFKMELSIELVCQNVTWKVPHLFQLLLKTGYFLNSPEFRFADDRYCLRFYPKWSNNEDTVDFDLHLVRLTSTFPERTVLYKVGHRWKSRLDYSYTGTLIGDLGFCLSRSQLEGERNKFFEDDTFTVLCSMRLKEQSNAGSPQSEEAGISHAEEKQERLRAKKFVTCGVQTEVTSCAIEREVPDNVVDKKIYKDEEWSAHDTKVEKFVTCAVQTDVTSCAIEREVPGNEVDKKIYKDEELSSHDTKGVALLSERMKELLIKGEDHDLTICVQNKEFRAHRSILKARSPVFAMMLTHDTKENNTGTISIEDCDPESFDQFLLYVYSGRTENLTPDNVLQLYYPADKYDFPLLKQRCVSLLKTSLSVESICDVVLLAAKHQEKELLEVATGFFARNMKKIIVTVGWQKFMSQNSVEANELIIKSMGILHPED